MDEERRRREEEFDKEWGNGPAHDHLCLQYVYNEFVRKMIDKTNYIKDDNFADIMNALIANDDKENFEIMLNILDKYYLYLYTTNVIPRMAYCDAVRCFAFSVKHMNKWNPDRYQEARINPDDEIRVNCRVPSRPFEWLAVIPEYKLSQAVPYGLEYLFVWPRPLASTRE